MARGTQVGDKAPDFTLPSQTGEPVRLSDRLSERVVVLYFYPKDETRGCTAEAKVVHFGRRTALAEGRITDATGKVHVTATSSCLVIRQD